MVGEVEACKGLDAVFGVVGLVRLPEFRKGGRACLLILYRTTFSGAFGTGALFSLSTSSILFNVFINVALYIIFTLICFFTARPPKPLIDTPRLNKYLPKPLQPKQMSREQTIAVCFCGAAKTTSLGIPLVSAMWARSDDLMRAYIQIPVLLYTIEQVFMAQILVYFFKWYLKRGRKGSEKDECEDASGQTVSNVNLDDGRGGTHLQERGP